MHISKLRFLWAMTLVFFAGILWSTGSDLLAYKYFCNDDPDEFLMLRWGI